MNGNPAPEALSNSQARAANAGRREVHWRRLMRFPGWPERWLALGVLSAALLVVVHKPSSSVGGANPDESAASALRLLSAATSPEVGSKDRAGVTPSAPNMDSPHRDDGQRATPPDGRAADLGRDLLALRDITRRDALPAFDGLVQLTAAESAALSNAGTSKPTGQSAVHAGAPQSSGPTPVPDRIEQVTDGPRDADRLQAVSIESGLRIFEGVPVPFALLRVQQTAEGRKALMAMRLAAMRPAADGSPEPSGVWVREGDDVAPGWKVLRIGSNDLLVLSARGNPIRLVTETPAGRPATPETGSSPSGPSGGAGRSS